MALRYRNRPQPQQPRKRWPVRQIYRYATLVWTDGDRAGRARMDADRTEVEVIIPNGMWSRVGTRIAMVRYPDGWVLAKRVVVGGRLL
jgi:hypothetical protein